MARSTEILNQTANCISTIVDLKEAQPIVADLGCGTGNNVLFLHDHLAPSTQYALIEQHHFLLEECRERISKQFSTGDTEFHFYHEGIIPWLEENRADVLTNSALIDLFTEAELRWLLDYIYARKTPMYTTLNYRGITFTPSDDNDKALINLFEQHMSRELDRGHPLGANCCPTLEKMIRQIDGLQEAHADSNWSVPTNDTDFIGMNLDFYEKGIREITTDETDHAKLDRWLEAKRNLLAKQQLALSVQHRDYFITAC